MTVWKQYEISSVKHALSQFLSNNVLVLDISCEIEDKMTGQKNSGSNYYEDEIHNSLLQARLRHASGFVSSQFVHLGFLMYPISIQHSDNGTATELFRTY